MNKASTSTQTQPRRAYAWLHDLDNSLTVGLVSLILVYILVSPWALDQVSRALIVNVLYLVLLPVLIWLAWRTGNRQGLDAGTRRAWHTFALAYGYYWGASLLWFVAQYVFQIKTSGSWIDVIFLLFYPLVLRGIFALLTSRHTVELPTFWLDTAATTLGGGMLLWYLLIRPLYELTPVEPFSLALSLAYSSGDLILIFGLASFLLRYPRSWSAMPYLVLAGAFALHGIADVSYGVLLFGGQYQDGGLQDWLWLLSMALVAVSAALQRHLVPVPPGVEQMRLQPTPLFGVLPYLGIALGYGLLFTYELGDLDQIEQNRLILHLTAMGLTLIVLARQVVAARENAQLRARREAEAALRRRLASEQCLAAISNDFINLPANASLDEAIDRALARLGTLSAVDRCYLLQLKADETIWSNTHEWCAAGIEPQIANLGATPVELVPWWTMQIRQGEVIYFPHLDLMPPEARFEQTMLEEQNVRSIIVMPVSAGGRFFGALGFDAVRAEKHWAEEDVRLLTLVSNLLARVLEHRCTEEALRASEASYSLLAAHATDLIACHTLDGVIRYCSPASSRLLGYPPQELEGRNLFSLVHPNDQAQASQTYEQLQHGSEEVTATYRVRRHKGDYIWLETTGRLIRDSDGTVREVVTVSRDVSLRQAREEQIAQQALHDPLTGLSNRRHLQQVATDALAQAAQSGTPLALLYVDLDRFKEVNDTLGHEAGDELLVQVAERLRGGIRERDTLARLGGDEFVLLMPGVEAAQAAVLARRLVAQLEPPFVLQGHELRIGASVGIAGYLTDGRNLEELLRRADQAMYQAKRGGEAGHGALRRASS